MEQFRAALPDLLKAFLQDQSASGEEEEVRMFPDQEIIANIVECQERVGLLLTFTTC